MTFSPDDDEISGTRKKQASPKDPPDPKTKSNPSEPNDFAELLQELKEAKPNLTAIPPSEATPEQINRVIDTILIDCFKVDKPSKIDRFEVKASICELLQQGAASPKFDKNRSSQVSSKFITVKQLHDTIRKVDSQLTPRKIARALRNDIVLLAQHWDIPGNLSKRYLTDNPNATIQELVWASDFHTFSQNPDLPEEVKDWLIQNFNNRWGKKAN